MNTSARFALRIAVAGLLALGLASAASAQTFPSKPVRVVVPFPAGGGADTIARVVTRELTRSAGQSFVVDARPGAGGNIAFEMVAKSPPDGYTIMVSTTGIAVNPTLYNKVPYKIDDFAAITLIGKAPMIFVVHPSLPVRSMMDFVKLAKASPGKLNAGAPTGTAGYFTIEVFRVMTGIDLKYVPYKGAAQAAVDVMNGQIEMTSMAVPASIGLLRSKRLRALAQSGEKRSPVVPDVPTMQEAGIKGYAVTTWYVVLGPAGIPEGTVNYLHGEIVKALKVPDVQARLQESGVGEIIGSTPAEAAAFVREETARWAKIIPPGQAQD